MQGPLSAVVLMLELTHTADGLMVPILLAVAEATIVARVLGAPSIYSARLQPQGDGRGPAERVGPLQPLTSEQSASGADRGPSQHVGADDSAVTAPVESADHTPTTRRRESEPL
jgi:hypothetical protein